MSEVSSVTDWSKKVVDVPGLFQSRARAYEQCVVAGPLIFVAGQVGYSGSSVVSREFEPQVRQTFENIRTVLRAAGADLKDLVTTTTYLTDARLMDEFLELRQEILAESFATSSLIGVDKLFHPELYVEISGIAVRPS